MYGNLYLFVFLEVMTLNAKIVLVGTPFFFTSFLKIALACTFLYCSENEWWASLLSSDVRTSMQLRDSSLFHVFFVFSTVRLILCVVDTSR